MASASSGRRKVTVIGAGMVGGTVAQMLAIRDYAAQENIDLRESCAFSDSNSDVPMLSSVGYPVATNPSRRLRRVALQNNWPILELREESPKFPPFLRTAKVL